MPDFDTHYDALSSMDSIPVHGRITDVVGLTIEALGPTVRIGDFCYIQPPHSHEKIPAEVVGFRGSKILLMPLGESHGICPESILITTGKPFSANVSDKLIGRVVNGLGDPIDRLGDLGNGDSMPVISAPPAVMERRRINEPITTGIRSIDGCITCGKGQRLGIMSGSGVGKSKLMGMIARNTDADINVIALIGERGKEVRDFIESDLGEEGLSRSIVVVATSDEPALVRIKGAYIATAIAEWFRAQGKDVMLMMDSVTRFAMAQREVGLAIGEPPTTKGYPPSVFSVLPKLMERAGTSQEGSITGIYTVLVEADDLNDPIGDAVRSITDGHVALSRDLASRGQYPAVNILDSVSRVMIDVTSEEHQRLAQQIRRTLATYQDAEDLINIGAYVEGSNPDIDAAIRLTPQINSFLGQGLDESSPWDNLHERMIHALS
jgi:flagellum-specific ATP synthase